MCIPHIFSEGRKESEIHVLLSWLKPHMNAKCRNNLNNIDSHYSFQFTSLWFKIQHSI